MQRALVLFDADCVFCRRVRVTLCALGGNLLLRWRPLQSGLGEQWGLSLETLAASLHAVSGSRIERGYRACKFILIRTPGFWVALAALVLLLPGRWGLLLLLAAALAFAPPFERFGESAYQYVASRRGSGCQCKQVKSNG
jgi:predicted DCC family thiol-disulfide oxidoreductase YuxK